MKQKPNEQQQNREIMNVAVKKGKKKKTMNCLEKCEWKKRYDKQRNKN